LSKAKEVGCVFLGACGDAFEIFDLVEEQFNAIAGTVEVGAEARFPVSVGLCGNVWRSTDRSDLPHPIRVIGFVCQRTNAKKTVHDSPENISIKVLQGSAL
jgi:hypothetical protein